MKDEIKEILKKIKSVSNFDDYVDFIGTEFKPLLDYIINLKKTNKNHSKKLIELGDKITNLQEENERLNNIINELEKDLDYEINDYTGNIDMKEETLSGEFCRGIAWEADYLKNRIKELKGDK